MYPLLWPPLHFSMARLGRWVSRGRTSAALVCVKKTHNAWNNSWVWSALIDAGAISSAAIEFTQTSVHRVFTILLKKQHTSCSHWRRPDCLIEAGSLSQCGFDFSTCEGFRWGSCKAARRTFQTLCLSERTTEGNAETGVWFKLLCCAMTGKAKECAFWHHWPFRAKHYKFLSMRNKTGMVINYRKKILATTSKMLM